MKLINVNVLFDNVNVIDFFVLILVLMNES